MSQINDGAWLKNDDSDISFFIPIKYLSDEQINLAKKEGRFQTKEEFCEWFYDYTD